MSRYLAGQGDATRANILAATVGIIRQQGLDAVTVGGVMAAAGRTHGGFYLHFASREALIAAALESLFDASRGTFNRRAQGASAKEALRAYISFYLSPEHRDRRDIGCSLALLSSDVARLAPDVQVGFAALFDGLSGRIATMLTEIGRPNPESAATSMLAEMIGALALARAIPDRACSDALLEACKASVLGRLE